MHQRCIVVGELASIGWKFSHVHLAGAQKRPLDSGSRATSCRPPADFPTEEMGIELACPVMFHEILGQLFNDQ
jgi:hypothetical protein